MIDLSGSRIEVLQMTEAGGSFEFYAASGRELGGATSSRVVGKRGAVHGTTYSAFNPQGRMVRVCGSLEDCLVALAEAAAARDAA